MEEKKKKKKTVGEHALEIDKGDRQEVGETLPGMLENYSKNLQEAIETSSDIKEFYIIVLRKKEPLFQNVIRQWMVSPRITRPSPYQLKTDYNLYDIDLWLVKNGDPFHQWSLPGPESWDTIINNPLSNDPDLVKWMKLFQKKELS